MTASERLLALAGQEPAPCVWLGLPNATIAEIAALAGFRLALIDTEHGTIGPETLPDILRALALHGASALVRIGAIDGGEVKRALDAGAAGILFPQVDSVAEARAAVSAATFPPSGRRGSAIRVVRAAGFGAVADYQEAWNDRVLTAVQIESRAALANASEIAAVPGVDMLFFGPFDYASDMGLDPVADTDLLESAFAEIVAAARAHGKIAGVFPWPGAEPTALAAAGASWIACAGDARTLADGFAAGVARLPGPG
ncbi:MAG: aldolase/citrate lyase family protein [Pseudomonadota bacterium]